MIDYDPHRWWHHFFDLKGSMVRQILYRVLAVIAWSLIVVLFDQWIRPVELPANVHQLVGVALGLLLVFRTNASYDRFWEGRKHWGGIVNETRNLARLSQTLFGIHSSIYQELLRWTIAFPYACMHSLRNRVGLGPGAGVLPSAK